jgi:hypothetical protein
MKIVFTTHAAEQIAKRKNIKVDTKVSYDARQIGFVYSKCNGVTPAGNKVEYWIYPNQSDLCVLVVEPTNRRVLTVLNEWRGVVPAAYTAYAKSK